MFNSIIFDVVMGLVFVYLLYSLLATILGEMISSWIGIRGRLLRKAIERMLNDGYAANGNNNSVNKSCNIIDYFFIFQNDNFGKSFAGKFYDYPSIKYLSEKKNEKPSYISKELFAQTLTNMLLTKGKGCSEMEKISFCLKFNTLAIQPQTLSYLRNLLESSKNDFSVFTTSLSNWFSETMDRTNGWYKRRMQCISFLLGLIIALSFNLDTISISRTLAKDKSAREQLVNLSIAASKDTALFKKNYSDTSLSAAGIDSSLRVVKNDIKDAGNIISPGWTCDTCTKKYSYIMPVTSHIVKDSVLADLSNLKDSIKTHGLELLLRRKDADALRSTLTEKIKSYNAHISYINSSLKTGFADIDSSYSKNSDSIVIDGRVQAGFRDVFFSRLRASLLGILITAIMISMGAPFWFSLLQKLVALRSAGVKPEEKKTCDNNMDDIGLIQAATRIAPPAPHVIVNKDATPDSLIEKCKKELLKIDGVISVMNDKNDQLKRSIHVFCNGNVEKSVIDNKINEICGETVKLNSEVKNISKVPSQTADSNAQNPRYGIANEIRTLGYGALGCVLKDKKTGEKHFMSCWHVMKGDRNFDSSESDSRIIIDSVKGGTIGKRWGGGIDNELDIAVARLDENETYKDNTLLTYGNLKMGYVSAEDVDNSLTVEFFDNISGTVNKGMIVNDGCMAKIWCKDQKYRDFHDLLVLQSADESTCLTQGGNSGSIVVHSENGESSVLAMIIADDGKFSYAIKMNKILDVYNQLTIV
jgi:hypothetical protein